MDGHGRCIYVRSCMHILSHRDQLHEEQKAWAASGRREKQDIRFLFFPFGAACGRTCLVIKFLAVKSADYRICNANLILFRVEYSEAIS